MACRGVHFALAAEDELRLRACAAEARPALISDDIEAAYFANGQEWLCETYKAWDAIHRAFNASELDYTYRSPLHGVVLGGEPLYFDGDYVISLKDAAQVREIAGALGSVSMEGFRTLYEQIDPEKYGLPPSELDFTYTWGWLQRLKPFYARAAQASRAVVFTVDQ